MPAEVDALLKPPLTRPDDHRSNGRVPHQVREDGAALLCEVEAFLSRFIVYPSTDCLVAHVLWTVHTHRMEAWESTPRIAFLSPEPGSGKSRALEVTELLVPRPVHAVNTTPAYLFRKVSDAAGLPTILYDEVDTLFGPRAKENEDVRGMLNAGHRKGAVAGRCVVKGKVVETEELPAYCAVALAGLDDLPDTLMSRSVVVRIKRRGPGEQIEPFRHRLHRQEGQALAARLEAWARVIPVGVWPAMPVGIADRDADIWEPLLAVADAAGGAWPERARCAAVTLVTASKAAIPSLGVRLLTDLHTLFADRETDRLFTEEIVSGLVAMEDAPWGELRGKPLDARGLARYLGRYEVKSQTLRVGNRLAKGYTTSALFDAWSRYVTAVTPVTESTPKRYMTKEVGNLGPPGLGGVTSVTAGTEDDFGSLTEEPDEDTIARWANEAASLEECGE